ncbi:hypothetical protein VD0002_g3844 [Verticillium dahliae]|uniref:Siderophore biosynthesis enzyme n=2 Tax=Verticillium dahliae TaxID=27337 RepID=G2X5Z9_VERDV|nr:uncharacterized protein VDAG_05315 [Verticillium dahliae VdLs.17]KAF3343108.1 hypothetical protein VdG2_09095 [Verticillium dahliae VDG2]KAH6701199.1 hypothetical protein EV126DRAFT_460311 [Verticillium dahliae]EGY14151.1 hypothetical protein VDAG_05315 [Verticillium dahliae VdLs.17]PNH28616.1 hypothetical protein BJF96_g8011 [Verticillium dahliae]PNH45874.1 hypothetical protein VD0004_g2111 [Verticillium dahliae]
MASMSLMLFTSAILLVAPVLAKTDLAGCTYSDSVVTPAGGFPYATRIWFVEDTGEICEFLDCGGGRAPPKTTVPGCGSYEGTDTYSPRFLAPSTTSVAAASTAEVISEAPTTKAPSLEPTPKALASTQSSKASQVLSGSQTFTAAVTTATPTSASETASESEGTEAGSQASATETPNAANAGSKGIMGLLAGAAMGAVLL